MATLALAFVVAAGAVAVVGVSRVGGTPGAVAAMLALYGAVALAEQSARTIVDRSHDVALARLRGLSGPRLVTFAAGPLLAVGLVGIAAGSLVGVWLAHRIAGDWNVHCSLGTREVVVAVAILVGAWVTIALVATAVIRRSLVDALSVHPRRQPTSWITLFLELLVVAAACLAVYEAHRSEAGWVPTVAPALVALGAGQLVMWLLTLTPRLGRRLGLSLASRRLRRDPDPGSVVRVLVAAAVLLAVTLTGGRAAADWRDDAGRLRAGGPIAVPFEKGALRAYAAAHAADPQGRWLMAAVPIDDLDPSARRVFVDSDRWDAVVGDFVGTTSVAGASAHMGALADQPDPLMVRSDSLDVDVTSIRPKTTGTVSVTLLTDLGYLKTARIQVTHTGSSTGPVGPCAIGCSVVSVDLGGAAFHLGQVSAGPTRILGATSHAAGRTEHALTVGQEPGEEAALTTSGLEIHANLDGIDGKALPIHVLGSVPAIPFLGRAGSLLDLGRVLRGAVGTVAGARPVVIARADTPSSVLARLHRDGGGKPMTYAAIADQLDHTPEARADSLALLVAIGVGLVALTHLLAWLAGQARRRRAEVAGLRAAGVRPTSVRGAYLAEAAILAVIVLVTAAATAVATTVPLLTPMELVGGWAEAPVLHPAIRPFTLASVVIGVAVVTALICAAVFTRFGRGARPGSLRAVDR
ncbi:MAG TPA: hypothetical protein VGK78_01380 [Nocardioides sp.]|uniref:hypothetical protein n=1 Tax=Nocardioides sp. TaxID=35761 RepID=UPI002F3E752D